jgi:hypothetical protein
MTTPLRKRSFSKFNLTQSYQALSLERLSFWDLQAETLAPSEFFQMHLQRLQKFDTRSSEESKKLLIDAVLEEAIQTFSQLKIWKGANLEGSLAGGYVDYLVGANRDYLDVPFLCVVEAKKDDFEQGLAQCLIEMQVCRERNQQAGKTIAVVYGIVTNADGWRFYRLLEHDCQETNLFAFHPIDQLLGSVFEVFKLCVDGF